MLHCMIDHEQFVFIILRKYKYYVPAWENVIGGKPRFESRWGRPYVYMVKLSTIKAEDLKFT